MDLAAKHYIHNLLCLSSLFYLNYYLMISAFFSIAVFKILFAKEGFIDAEFPF